MTALNNSDQRGNVPERAEVVSQPAMALALILETRPELFINVVGQPTIRLPDVPGRSTPETWPLRSDRVKAWIAEFVWNRTGIVLADREIDRIVTVLVGKAWQDPRHDVELTEAMDADPLLEALLIFMHDHAVFDTSCTALKAALDDVALLASLDTKDRLWPKAAPQLSQRIENLKPLLKRASITAELGRRAGGKRFVRLLHDKPSGGDAAGPPLPPSVDNSHHPTEFRRRDGGDVDLRKQLFDLVRTPNEETNDEGH